MTANDLIDELIRIANEQCAIDAGIKIETSVYQDIKRVFYGWKVRTFTAKTTHVPTRVFYDAKQNCLVIRGE